jgi:hypothetical protein
MHAAGRTDTGVQVETCLTVNIQSAAHLLRLSACEQLPPSATVRHRHCTQYVQCMAGALHCSVQIFGLGVACMPHMSFSVVKIAVLQV